MSEHVLRPPTARRSAESLPFWDGLEQGLIRFQRCGACRRAVWHPRYVCPYCLSRELAWENGGGRGALYSQTIVRHAPYARWESELPYALGIVQMDEDYFLYGRLLGADRATRELLSRGSPLKIGDRMTTRVERMDGEPRLVFVPES